MVTVMISLSLSLSLARSLAHARTPPHTHTCTYILTHARGRARYYLHPATSKLTERNSPRGALWVWARAFWGSESCCCWCRRGWGQGPTWRRRRLSWWRSSLCSSWRRSHDNSESKQSLHTFNSPHKIPLFIFFLSPLSISSHSYHASSLHARVTFSFSSFSSHLHNLSVCLLKKANRQQFARCFVSFDFVNKSINKQKAWCSIGKIF